MAKPHDLESSTLALLFRSPLVLSVFCPLSFAAMALFLGGRWDPNRVRLWHLLMAVQPGIWLASVFAFFHARKRHRLDWSGRRGERAAVVLCTILAWAMNSFPSVTQLLTQQWAMPENLDALLQWPHARAKLSLLGLLSAMVATLHASVMLRVHVQLLVSPWEPAVRGVEPTVGRLEEEVLRYQRLREHLERSLLFSALIIGVSALSIGAFRNLLHEFAPSQVFEPSRSLGYGIYYTVILASVYVPTRKTLTDVGEAFVTRFVPPFPATGTSRKDWSQEQQAVRTWLGLQNSALQDFQQGFAVLAPLLASLSAMALGAGA
jgi:hypothetical protein